MHDSQDEAKIQGSLNRFIVYAQSSDKFNRNLVGQTALETLPIVASNPEDVATVLELLSTVATDPEIDVRCSVLEYIVHIALFLSDPEKSSETLKSFITSHVLPIIVTALVDDEPKVVKLADCSLIVLLEHCLVPNSYVQERFWPAIKKKMYDPPLNDSIVRVITLMRKMVPWVSRETTETLFVPLFVQLCSYQDTRPGSQPEIVQDIKLIKKACASIIGDFCVVVSLNTVESKLVPSFLSMCSDSCWAVRTLCAAVFTSVSSAASMSTRKNHLTPAFATLLADPTYYVRSAAYQYLGPFITTFADPSITNLGYNHRGKLVLKHPNGFEYELNSFIEHDLEVFLPPDDMPPDEVGWDGVDNDDDLVLMHLNLSSSKENADKDYRSLLEDYDCTINECETQVLQSLETEKGNLEISSNSNNQVQIETVSQSTCDETNASGIILANSVENNDSNEKEIEQLENISLNSDACDEICNNKNKVNSNPENTQMNQSNPVETTAPTSSDGTCPNQDINKLNQSKDIAFNEDNFNSFIFWRDPIPDIEINLDKELVDIIKKTNASSTSPSTPSEDEPFKCYEVNVKKSRHRPAGEQTSSNRLSAIKKSLRMSVHNKALVFPFLRKYSAWKKTAMDGDGNNCDVPDVLINYFVSMSSSRLDEMHAELSQYCAYNLPAVALTLGPENWAPIKEACNALATHEQWRIRRTIACSMHELAVIVGSEVATKDLLPVFIGFIKDLDEVRIGALKHLANFLKTLKESARDSFLPRLAEFLITDYEWNWRFRAEFAEQLLQIVRLFTPQDISVHITPVVFTLLQDKVAHVRSLAVQLVVEVICVLSLEGVLIRSAVAELAEQFAHSSRWSRRQTFAHLCSELVEAMALPTDMFARDILPHLLDLSWDKVPNVRLSVARTLSHHVMLLDTFSNPSSPHHEVVMVVLKRLQNDKDIDVKYFASTPSTSSSKETHSTAQLPEGSMVDSNKIEVENEDNLR